MRQAATSRGDRPSSGSPHAIPISSPDDPRLDVFRNVPDKDLRREDGLFMAESEMVLRQLLRTPDRIQAILLTPSKYARLEPYLSVLPPETPICVVEQGLASAIAGYKVHRGVLASCYRLPAGDLTIDRALGHLRDQPHLTLVLAERLFDVDNVGALFRNAAAFGADAVVLDRHCCDPLYRKAIRTSIGHVLSLPYAVSEDWPRDLSRLKSEWGLTLVGAELTADAVPIWELPRADRIGLLFGSEDTGVLPETLALCDAVCQVPMARGASLNVGVASAVCLYELRRGSPYPTTSAGA